MRGTDVPPTRYGMGAGGQESRMEGLDRFPGLAEQCSQLSFRLTDCGMDLGLQPQDALEEAGLRPGQRAHSLHDSRRLRNGHPGARVNDLEIDRDGDAWSGPTCELQTHS